MTKEILLAKLEQTTQQLTEILLSFPAERFNTKPSETEWSPAQVAEHLLKVDLSTGKAISGETIPTNRPPDEKIGIIKHAMDDDSTRRMAPERVSPSGEHWEPS